MIKKLIESLNPLYQPFLEKKYEIYLVGGAVRDLLLGNIPKDFDFTTNAPPETVQKLFRRTIPTGLKHGTITVMLGSVGYEVTTFRTDGEYEGHRKPKDVVYTPSIEEDLKRRDFTINGLALSLPAGEIIDFHQGISDLENRIIKSIGNPAKRFQEDALRILRACRFAAKLGFHIESATWTAMKEMSSDISFLSRERVHDELNKTVNSPRPGYGWELLRKSEILPQLKLKLPGETFKPGDLESLLNNHVQLLLPSRWAILLLFYCDQPETWLKALTFSNYEIKEILQRVNLVKHLINSKFPVNPGEMVFIWGDRDWKDAGEFILTLMEAGYFKTQKITSTIDFESWKKKADSSEPVFIKDLALQGVEIMAYLNKSGGPWLGELLEELQRTVWLNPEINTKDLLKELIGKINIKP